VSLEPDCPAFPAGLEVVRELCAPTPQFAPKLALIDPFGYYTSSQSVEKEAAEALTRLASHLDICILISRHTI
jgi:hypothetical protein